MIDKNRLYFGDCLEVLKNLHQEFPKGIVDLVYIDPPFNSKRNYNILFEEVELKDTKAQKQAFADTWSNVSYIDTLYELEKLDKDIYDFLEALDKIKTGKGSISYLTTMAIRIFYIHKVLNKTGSFYLHCDSTMSHYLKILCDLIFGELNFKNEIIWKRTSAHSGSKKFGRNTDRILFYTKSSDYTFNALFHDYSTEYLDKNYRQEDEKGRFKSDDLTGAGETKGDSSKEWRGYDPTKRGRHWAIPREALKDAPESIREGSSIQKLEYLNENGLIYFTKQGTPRFKRYLNEEAGVGLQEIWSDIAPISSQSNERLGFPTQKPIELLERIIKTSTNEGDVVADFFCGCGTTISASEKLGRNWIGADISHLSINLIKKRLIESYGKSVLKKIVIDGLPMDLASAKELAVIKDNGRIKFQDWVIEVLIGGITNPKKVGDGGYDGYDLFPHPEKQKKSGRALIEVKSGKVNIAALRSFINVIEKEKGDIGVFVCFEDQVTSGMLKEAKKAGRAFENWPIDKIQIVTVDELLEGGNYKKPGGGSSNMFKKSNMVKDRSIKFEF